MTDMRNYHRVGDLRMMFPPDTAGAVIRAFMAHSEIIAVDPTTGAEVAGHVHMDERAYVVPAVWEAMVNTAMAYNDRLETIEHVRAVRTRLATQIRTEKKAIKRIREWMQWADREEIELRKTRDTAGQGELEYLRAQALKDLADYENKRTAHVGMIGTCDDVLQNI